MGSARSDEKSLEAVRRAYARRALSAVGVRDDVALERAFAETPREAFLGPGPWLASNGLGYERTSGDARQVYRDVLIALKPEKQINNGSPTLHAHWLHAAALKGGETVVHVGAGSGYYTALLARLVGPAGRVVAVEFDAGLAEAARENLVAYSNVTVAQGDGAEWPRERCDLVYVNFAADRPAGPWLEQMKPGGRLIFPLGTIARDSAGSRSHGAGLRVERVGDSGVYAAKSLGGAYFVRAEGGGELLASGAEREALLKAFEKGGIEFVRSLHWGVPPSKDRSWFVGEKWSLAYDEP